LIDIGNQPAAENCWGSVPQKKHTISRFTNGKVFLLCCALGMRQLSEQLAELKDKRGACNRVRVVLRGHTTLCNT
jgi:hypothetical protein